MGKEQEYPRHCGAGAKEPPAGSAHLEESSIPELFKRREKVDDEWMTATNKDLFDALRLLVEKEGIVVGPSSGSVMTSMLRAAQNVHHGVIVGIFADDGTPKRQETGSGFILGCILGSRGQSGT